ncbi:hypothetical protein ACFOSV_04475 [Algoriphagus namhaensis]|uniref:Uncharacterized protein n=1 Tax=Algoriphagus namhaensis TaxID=915353 RepID=A0ABV8AN28_9BACT
MATFDPLQSIYNSQNKRSTDLKADNVLFSAKSALKQLRKDQYWTVAIMSSTLILLTYFFYEIGRFGDWQLITALAMMIGSLVLRVVLEFSSRMGLKKLQLHLPTSEFLNSIQRYHQSRKRIQSIWTPVIYIIYGIGIVLMLVAVRPFLSTGFYSYCVITGLGFWIGFIWVIRLSYRKERELLKGLEELSS